MDVAVINTIQNTRILLLAALVVWPVYCFAQSDSETSFQINETEIEMVYNHYMQDGDNSAVTGGIGTERLIVYGPSFSLDRSFGANSISFNIGSDIISSASTDNIDFDVSSASRLDARSYVGVGYGRLFKNGQWAVNGGLSLSIESDYFSFGKSLGSTYTTPDKLRTISLQLQIFNDDLRWGRLQDGLFQAPRELIYPEELRFREWYDEFRRNSYHLSAGLTQVVNSRNTVGLSAILSYQQGLLATPFHRVFFNDGSVVVEQLPNERFKGAVRLQWNTFIGGGLILRNSVHGYADSFGILGIAVENETTFKLNTRWSLSPGFRLYTQAASRYFAPFQEHDPGSEFYTSDFDLSQFESYSIGLAIRHVPLGKPNKAQRPYTLRYNYYGRSNNLSTHSISMVLGFLTKSTTKK